MSDQDSTAQQPAPDLKALGEKATALQVVAAGFKKLSDDATSDLRNAMLTEYQRTRVRPTVEVDTDASGPEPERAVTFTVRQPTAGPAITDPNAFAAHCDTHYSEHVEWVPRVRPAFEMALLARAVRDRDLDKMVDPMTGLVVEGMTWVPARPATSITPSWKKDGKDRVLAELLSNDGTRAELMRALALPAGDSQDGGAQA